MATLGMNIDWSTIWWRIAWNLKVDMCGHAKTTMAMCNLIPWVFHAIWMKLSCSYYWFLNQFAFSRLLKDSDRLVWWLQCWSAPTERPSRLKPRMALSLVTIVNISRVSGLSDLLFKLYRIIFQLKSIVPFCRKGNFNKSYRVNLRVDTRIAS